MKLNLGCGNDLKQGWVNVDKGNCNCDVNHDIEVFPWPWEDNSVDYVLMQHILEHIAKEKFIPLLREMYRVCKNGAVINIISPYAISDNFMTDPTHKLPLTPRTFDFFDSSRALYENGKIYGWDDIKLEVIEGRLIENLPNGPDVGFNLRIKK